MTEITLEFNADAAQTINDLRKHYGMNTAEIFKKGIGLLKLAAHIEDTQGQLIARKGNHDTILNTR